MGDVKRKRPWEKKNDENFIHLIVSECLWQCIICIGILITALCINQFSANKNMLYLLDEEINKTLQKEELYFLVDTFEDIISEYRK